MALASSLPSSSNETMTMKQRRPRTGLRIPNRASGAAVAVAVNSDGVPFLGTPYASNQPFDYPFPVNCLPPDPLLGPQKSPSALPIASSLVSATSLVHPSCDPLVPLPSVVSSLVSRNSADRPDLRHSRSHSSLVSARSTKSLQSLLSQGSGSCSPSPSSHTPLNISPSKSPSLSSRNPSPTLAMPSLEPRSVGVTPRRRKSLTLSTNQASKSSANLVSSATSHSSGIGSFSSLSFTSIVDDKHIPPTLRSKLQRTGALVVASDDALPRSTEASARATPHDPLAQGTTLRPAPLPLLKRPLPVRAYSHTSSFLHAARAPIQEPEETVVGTAPSPTNSMRISRQSSMKCVIKKTASLVELGLEGLKRATSGRSSASSRRSRTRAGSCTQETTEASGDSNRMVMIGALEAPPNVIKEEGHPTNLKK